MVAARSCWRAAKSWRRSPDPLAGGLRKSAAMRFATVATALAEHGTLPDLVIRAGMRRVIAANDRVLPPAGIDAEFARDMGAYPIAEHTDAANRQHYELPPEFFALFLGPRRKYSSCLYPTGREILAEAEAVALVETMAHAGVRDGEDILELGCGWGSLSLALAEKFPAARITAVSNSTPQRRYIQAQALARGLSNLTIITADMNDFTTHAAFDRVVSVEMFEHMANWRALLTRVKTWLKPDGRLNHVAIAPVVRSLFLDGLHGLDISGPKKNKGRP